jgi:hypothetical protein
MHAPPATGHHRIVGVGASLESRLAALADELRGSIATGSLWLALAVVLGAIGLFVTFAFPLPHLGRSKFINYDPNWVGLALFAIAAGGFFAKLSWLVACRKALAALPHLTHAQGYPQTLRVRFNARGRRPRPEADLVEPGGLATTPLDLTSGLGVEWVRAPGDRSVFVRSTGRDGLLLLESETGDLALVRRLRDAYR